MIHDSIDDYYDKLPDIWKTEASKQNTADIVFITKGNKAQLFAELPNMLRLFKVALEKANILNPPPLFVVVFSLMIEWFTVTSERKILIPPPLPPPAEFPLMVT